MSNRTVHIISSLGLGGAEATLDKLTARGQQQDVSVICLTGDGPVGERIAGRGIPVWSLGLQGTWRDLISLWHLFIHLRRIRPAIVQTWLYHGDLVGGLIARAAGVRCVVWNVRNSGAALQRLSARTRAIVYLNGWLSHWVPSKILCCSETARRNHVALGYADTKFTVIPNGFDIEKFAPDIGARSALRGELGLDDDAILVGLVARFDPQKNHRGFIEAASKVLNKQSDVKFIMVGHGIDSSNTALRDWTEKYGIASAVHLLGQRNDMPLVTAAFDVAVNSSLGEGFPNSVGEAMACGVPCVVTDVGDSADIVGPTGRVVAAGDSVGLGNQILLLLALSHEERIQLGDAARRRVADRYEIGNVVGGYQAFYASLVEKKI